MPVAQGMAMFTANFAKRYLEKGYDNFFTSEIGKSLKDMRRSDQLFIEFLLNLLVAIVDQKIDETTVTKKFIKEILVDAAPEISKRILNGGGLPAGSINPEGVMGLINYLLETDTAILLNITSWLKSIEGARRPEVIKILSSLPADKLEEFSLLSPADQEKFIGIPAEKSCQLKIGNEKICNTLDKVNDTLRNYIKRKKEEKENV